ncbi:MAG: acylphosphatase [Sphingomicrobium sp.]
MPKAARHVRVTGRVQGVFFRAWTREQAERLGVFGWVRNCPDGSVEAHLEGPEQRVAELFELLKRGPSGARVDKVEIEDVELENHDWFAVRH